MNILITGGCGFIGSHFINYFMKTNKDYVNIVNIDAMYYCANENNVIDRENEKYIFIKSNVRNSEVVGEILQKYSITHVIHFAAQSHVDNSFDNSIEYTYDNVLGTHTLLECCRLYQLKTNKLEKFIHVSTDEVYGESGEEQKTEKSILLPTNPYAASKAAAELIVQSYIHSYKLPIIITRGNNVYGPRQYPEKVIPLFISQLKSGKKVSIHGDGSSKRSFLHVDDTVSAFYIILQKGILGEIYNIGCDPVEEQKQTCNIQEWTILDIAKLLIKLIKNKNDFNEYNEYSQFIKYIPDRLFNDARYYISNSKIKQLGWEIKTPFLKGISDLILVGE